jgi:hypothetical protein
MGRLGNAPRNGTIIGHTQNKTAFTGQKGGFL